MKTLVFILVFLPHSPPSVSTLTFLLHLLLPSIQPPLQSPAILSSSVRLSPSPPSPPLQPWRPAGLSCPSRPWRGPRATCCWGVQVAPPCPRPSVPPCSSTGRLSSLWCRAPWRPPPRPPWAWSVVALPPRGPPSLSLRPRVAAAAS